MIITLNFIKRSSCMIKHRQFPTTLKRLIRHSYLNARRLLSCVPTRIFISQTQYHKGHNQPYHALFFPRRNVVILKIFTCFIIPYSTRNKSQVYCKNEILSTFNQRMIISLLCIQNGNSHKTNQNNQKSFLIISISSIKLALTNLHHLGKVLRFGVTHKENRQTSLYFTNVSLPS